MLTRFFTTRPRRALAAKTPPELTHRGPCGPEGRPGRGVTPRGRWCRCRRNRWFSLRPGSPRRKPSCCSRLRRSPQYTFTQRAARSAGGRRQARLTRRDDTLPRSEAASVDLVRRLSAARLRAAEQPRGPPPSAASVPRSSAPGAALGRVIVRKGQLCSVRGAKGGEPHQNLPSHEHQRY